jgi:hypothetical protein
MKHRKTLVSRRRGDRTRFAPVPALIEILEARQLLSAAAASALSKLVAQPTVIVTGTVGGNGRGNSPAINPAVAGISPSQMQTAYGINLITFGSVAGTGAGQTIALIDAYNDPNIISDANTFSTTFGLPQFNGSGGPTLQVLNETGGTSLPTNDGADSWALEESLDVEWAHAVAPQANIILYEASSSGFDLYTAAQTAAATAGVSVVSMSWGASEYSFESGYDSYFTTPSGHAGVTFLASTGDSGAPAEYPAFSPNVVAIGGTTLTLNADNTYASESAWSRSGGGISQYESQPSYQSGKVNGTSSSFRTAPDVSMDAGSSVAVLDTYNSGWTAAAGTSLSTPMWAGLIAIANQGLAINGVSPLNGATQTLPTLYNLPSSDFHDITTGNNGFAATTGYDLASGLGTPVANTLVPDIVSNYSGTTHAPTITSTNQATFTVGTAGTFTVTATGSPSPTFGESGSLPFGLTFNSANGVLSGTPAAGTAGTYNITFTASNGVGSDATQSFTLTIAQASTAPTITSANSTTFTVGSAGSFSVTATGSPAPTFGESGSLPAGLTFNSSRGVLSGTPSAGTGGTYTVTFTASNGVGQASQSFTITVDQAPLITSANSATFTAGAAGSFSVTATGFPAPTFGVRRLPAWLTLNSSTGLLSGTPPAGAGGTYSITLTASNGVGQRAIQKFTIIVNQAAAITNANITALTVGGASSFSATASGFPDVTFDESEGLAVEDQFGDVITSDSTRL